MTTLVVPGQPVPCGRPRMTRGGHAFMPERTRRYEASVRRLARSVFQAPEPGDVSVSMLFVLPDRRRRDLDNLAKSVMDGMNGVAFLDDSQVVSLSVSKVCRKGEGCAVVDVSPCPHVDAWESLWGVIGNGLPVQSVEQLGRRDKPLHQDAVRLGRGLRQGAGRGGA